MQAKAKLRFLRMSPKKARLVADLIRGMKVEEAISQLGFINKAAKRPILKLLNSAIANAENNFDLKKDNLYIQEIRVDQGGILQRWQPRAHGRATPIRKRMSHISIILDEIEATKPKKSKTKTKKDEKPIKVSSLEEVKERPKSKGAKEEVEKKSKTREQKKEIDKQIVDPRRQGKHRHKQHQDKTQMKGKKGFMQKIFKRKAG